MLLGEENLQTVQTDLFEKVCSKDRTMFGTRNSLEWYEADRYPPNDRMCSKDIIFLFNSHVAAKAFADEYYDEQGYHNEY